jgi:hypothetical protein
MTQRDVELEGVIQDLRRGDPYIERPDEIPVDIGAACFLNGNRVCGADCSAFTDPHAPTAQERCLILSSVSTGLELLQELVRAKRPREAYAPNIEPPRVRTT